MTDTGAHYVPMRTRLARSDPLTEYLEHAGSALFAIHPGAREGRFVGHELFA